MKPRDLIRCNCNSCGSGYMVYYDLANDYYICTECLDADSSNEEDYEEEIEIEDHTNFFEQYINKEIIK